MNDLRFLDALGLHETSLPRQPQHTQEKSGQPQPNRGGQPRQPRHAPTQNNEVRAESRQPVAAGEGGEQDKQSAAEAAFRAGHAAGYLECWRALFYLSVLSYRAQMEGRECNGCQHQTMLVERHPGTRRKFFWRCERGHVQLETGCKGERIIIAPEACTDYASVADRRP